MTNIRYVLVVLFVKNYLMKQTLQKNTWSSHNSIYKLKPLWLWMRNWNSLPSSSLNSIWPGLFWCIRDPGGRGHIVPPLNIFGLGGVWVQILVGNDFSRHDLPYSKRFMEFGCQESSKKCLTFETFARQRGVWPVCKGPPLWNFGIFDKLFSPAKRDKSTG